MKILTTCMCILFLTALSVTNVQAQKSKDKKKDKTSVKMKKKDKKMSEGDTMETTELKTKMDSVSYSAGVYLVEQLKAKGLTKVNPEIMLQAINDVMEKKDMAIERQDASNFLRDYAMERQKAQKEENKIAGEKFLAENAKKEGIKVTDSGLQYMIIKGGAGVSPMSTDKVTVHYKGTTIDGEEFDSSYKRGEPTSFPLNRVIKGWTEGLQLMKPGSHYRFFIPSELAYGERGASGAIGPNETLIFDVELISVN